MSGFNLDNYETVKQRKLRFYCDNPDGRIRVQLVNTDLDEKAVVKASVFLNKDDEEKNLPKGEGYALELRDKTLSKNKYGKDYESVNYSSWLENSEESAVGRALDNAGYASNGKCSRDEIEKAQRNLNASRPTETKRSSNPNEFIIEIGTKFKGKNMYECQPEEIHSFVNWLKYAAAKKSEPLKGHALELVERAEKWFAVVKQERANK